MPTHTNSAGEIDYRCPQNHRVHGSNIEMRTNGKGRSYPNCRTCRQAYRRSYRARPEVIAKKRAKAQERVSQKNEHPVIYALSGAEISWENYMPSGEKRSAPWNLLRPKPEASLVFDEFHDALKLTDVPCRGRAAEFIDYADPRPAFAEDNEGRLPMPTADEARELCKSCPLIELCGAYAAVDRPDFGIFAGKRYVAGKVVS